VSASRTLIIACGALAREILDIKRLNLLDHLDLTCLPAIWHNRPEKIAPAMRVKIRAAKRKGYGTILCGYGDCGTAGALDAVLAEEGVVRLEGAHCYAFYAGITEFEAMHEAEIGTFYLTDYLVRHFDRLIITGLGLDRFPELRDAYFGHYTRVMYLAQTNDDALVAKAERAAAQLGLPLAVKPTGYGLIPAFLQRSSPHGQPRDPLLA
jgi:hypothetical protein